MRICASAVATVQSPEVENLGSATDIGQDAEASRLLRATCVPREAAQGRGAGGGAGWRWERDALSSAMLPGLCRPGLGRGYHADAGRELLWLWRKLEGLSYLTARKRSSRLRVAPNPSCSCSSGRGPASCQGRLSHERAQLRAGAMGLPKSSRRLSWRS